MFCNEYFIFQNMVGLRSLILLIFPLLVYTQSSLRRCYTCRSRGQQGDCKDPFTPPEPRIPGLPLPSHTAAVHEIPCSSGTWDHLLLRYMISPAPQVHELLLRYMISPAPQVHELPCSSGTWSPLLLRYIAPLLFRYMISPAPQVNDLPCSSCTWSPLLLMYMNSPSPQVQELPCSLCSLCSPCSSRTENIHIHNFVFLLLFFYNYTSFFQVGVKKLWTGWIKMMEMISELRQNELVCREVQVMEKNGKQYIYYQNTFIYMRISDPNVLNKKDVYDIQCYQNKRKGGGC